MFKYNTTKEINKSESKSIYKDETIQIDKLKNTYMSNEIKVINKNDNKLLNKKINDITILNNKMVERVFSSISKNDAKGLYTNAPNINIEYLKNLSSQNVIELSKQNAKELKAIDLRQININHEKELKNKDDLGFYKTTELELAINSSSQLYKIKDVYLKDQDVNCLNIYDSKFMEPEITKQINIQSYYFYNNNNKRYINKVNDKYFDRINDKQMSKHNNRLMYRYNVNKLFKNDIDFLDRITRHDLYLNDSLKLIYRLERKDINKYDYINGLEKISLKHINKDESKKYFYRHVLRTTYKNTENYLNRVVIIPVYKNNQSYLDRENLINLYKETQNYLGREMITTIFKNNDFYLNAMSIIDVYKQIEKKLLDLNILDAYKDYDKYLMNTPKNIYKENINKFIEVTKRWWWLQPTSPTDGLVVPNKDYVKMKDIMENTDFEYLRYNSHPVEWGQNWGIDYNVPPIGVSVEIMIDLINIITMVWHKNVQGWMSCTGRESIQLLMEILYDWYTLDTSIPNTDYYRTYRWIRWEAEKVYFLNAQSGLRAIGILISNLIDYMKYHHFNLVPLWRNAKVMDIERNFNRMATDGDLMKITDKLKGKRNYMIETQNFEKKNILGR
ncbi:hypothetical protein LL038_03055 [Clostridium estertheticum]|uniref:Uncharacterized protein n=2 Tax=Clostridium estertheticum TaxID=238834 RepID=A0AA47EJI8_9CLOT|nr:hypothetical protein LL038_03055 [Clostridium estertheticum]